MREGMSWLKMMGNYHRNNDTFRGFNWYRICLQWRRPRFNSWVGKIRWRRVRLPHPIFLGFPGDSAGKESTCNAGAMDSIPGLGRCPGMATHSSILAWRIPFTCRVRHDWTTFTLHFSQLYFYIIKFKFQNLENYKYEEFLWSQNNSVRKIWQRYISLSWVCALILLNYPFPKIRW